MQYRFKGTVRSTEKPFVSGWFEVGDMHMLNEHYFFIIRFCDNIILELKGDEKSEQNDKWLYHR